jgi:hypothetical protein
MKRWTLFFLLLVTACAPLHQNEGAIQAEAQKFSIQIPEQWHKLNTPRHLMLTKDGPFSQYILVQQRHLSEPFKHTKRRLEQGMLPQEAAEVIVAEITSDRKVLDFEVIENLPARISRFDAFRLVFSYRTTDGLKFKTIYYGTLPGSWYYGIRYNASDTCFSEKDIETFERFISRFAILEGREA